MWRDVIDCTEAGTGIETGIGRGAGTGLIQFAVAHGTSRRHVVVHQSGVLRVNGNLAVSRAIGDFNHQPFVSDEAYLAKVSLTSEDQVTSESGV